MYCDFLEALNKKYNCNSAEDLTGMDLQHYKFASSTNGRGLNAIGEFEAYGFCMDGLKILDVGCAYGGFSIEAAKKGAECYGVEISPSLYEFACLNTKNEAYHTGSCEFVLVDATSTEFLEKIPHNYFDLIIVNDVFEHVYDTVQLLKNLSVVANYNCTLYFAIPNGNDLRFVAREGHSGYVGLSIISPLNWQKLTGKEIWNIYYRQYEYYQALFSYFGFSEIVPINYPGHVISEDTMKKIVDEYQNTKQIIHDNEKDLPKDYITHLNSACESFDKQFNYDLKELNVADIYWKYLTKFWAGFAHRKKLNLNPVSKTVERKASSDKAENIDFVLSLDGSELSVEITCDFPIDEYEFAFDLLIRGERIDRTTYQKSPCYKWNLKSDGMYWVNMYIKHKDHEFKDYCICAQPLYYSGT